MWSALTVLASVAVGVGLIQPVPPKDAISTSVDGSGGSAQIVEHPATYIVEGLTDTGTAADVVDASEVPGIDKKPPLASVRAFSEATGGAAAVSSSGMSVTYTLPHPPAEVRTVLEAAVQAWDAVIEPVANAPIVLEIGWEAFGSTSLLGFAGPEVNYVGGDLPRDNLLYPAGLANVLLGQDSNGPSRPEVRVKINSDLYSSGRWHLGSGTPPAGKIDLGSVMIHEIGHGLGFLGSASNGPALHDPPSVFDSLVTWHGTPITQLTNPAAVLTSNDLQLHLGQSIQAEVYAPSTWQSGSSLSHLDDSEDQSGALMNPSISHTEVYRRPDAWTLGVLAELGWPLRAEVLVPTVTAVATTEQTARLSWSIDMAEPGLPPDFFRLEARRDNAGAATSVQAIGAATTARLTGLSPGSNYTLRLIPFSKGVPGTAVIRNITTPGQAAKPAPTHPTFIRSQPLDGQISRVFQAYFLRYADEDGFSYWLGRRAAGEPLISVYDEFASSAEFINRYGTLSNAQFVDLVYRNVLDRTPEASGRTYWISELAGGMLRAEVMMGFAESAEFVRITKTPAPYSSLEGQVRRLYQAAFLRPPDDDGLNFWYGQATGGTGLEEISSEFVGSAEFTNRYGSLNNSAFVNLVYQNVLGRAPDAQGRAFWSDQLASGADRGDMLLGFSESTEYVRSTGTLP